MKNNNKKVIGVVIFIFVLTIVIGTSFALWQLTFRQSTTNTINTDCFKVEFNDKNPISLENSYPLTDANGAKLSPYTFTLTNTCNTDANYQVNLEVLNETTLMNHSYIKNHVSK